MARLDRDALKITGDPEALITALAKLRRLHLLPLVSGEKRGADAGAGGWYVVGSTALIAVLTVLSFLPYRRHGQEVFDQDAPAPEAIDPAARAR